MNAGFGEGVKLVLLFQLTLGCVVHERSILQSYKEIAGPTPPAHRLSLAGNAARGG